MLACIPTQGNAGRDDRVHDHFGSAPFFTFYNSESDEVSVLPNQNAQHEHGNCQPLNHLAQQHIDCVICGGMGRRAIEAFNAEGIAVFQSNSETVGELIEKIRANDLTPIDPKKACRGHGQPQNLTGPTQVGQGRGSGFGQMQGGHGGNCGCGGKHGRGES
ncbi:MAG: NifB/NifX family molybdenum-iron cluster-binding protein [bacterium]